MRLPSVQKLLSIPLKKRGELIEKLANSVKKHNNIKDEQLKSSFKQNSIINNYIEELVEIKRRKVPNFSNDKKSRSFIEKIIKDLLDNSAPEFKKDIDRNRIIPDKKMSVFQLLEIDKLAVSQKQTRSITERLGHLIEDIACLSPNCLSPENDFNIKLPGIDVIIYNTENKNKIHCQLKTAKNTLTGSQAPRMKKELKIFDYPCFAAAIKTGASWTTGKTENHGIVRVVGEDFWRMIDIPYDIVLKQIKALLLLLQKYVVEQETTSKAQIELLKK